MADSSFGLKIGLEGEREFKRAITDINREMRVLGSEMKLVASQFEKNDQSAAALTARNQALGREIEAQRSKVETLRSALENAASSFGENDSRTKNWQIQLNNAQATLNGLEGELKENNAALAKFGDEADGAGDDAKDAAKDTSHLESAVDDLGSEMDDYHLYYRLDDASPEVDAGMVRGAQGEVGPPPVITAAGIKPGDAWGVTLDEAGPGTYRLGFTAPTPEGVSEEMVRRMVHKQLVDVELLAMAGL